MHARAGDMGGFFSEINIYHNMANICKITENQINLVILDVILNAF